MRYSVIRTLPHIINFGPISSIPENGATWFGYKYCITGRDRA
jgi:hypothetical protein